MPAYQPQCVRVAARCTPWRAKLGAPLRRGRAARFAGRAGAAPTVTAAMASSYVGDGGASVATLAMSCDCAVSSSLVAGVTVDVASSEAAMGAASSGAGAMLAV